MTSEIQFTAEQFNDLRKRVLNNDPTLSLDEYKALIAHKRHARSLDQLEAKTKPKKSPGARAVQPATGAEAISQIDKLLGL